MGPSEPLEGYRANKNPHSRRQVGIDCPPKPARSVDGSLLLLLGSGAGRPGVIVYQLELLLGEQGEMQIKPIVFGIPRNITPPDCVEVTFTRYLPCRSRGPKGQAQQHADNAKEARIVVDKNAMR